MTKIPPKNTKLPPLFSPQKRQNLPQKIQKWPHGFSPKKWDPIIRLFKILNLLFKILS
jgi:hypothetical protein